MHVLANVGVCVSEREGEGGGGAGKATRQCPGTTTLERQDHPKRTGTCRPLAH